MPKDRKHELQQKAIQLFVKKGYEKTTLRDLGKAVGIKGPGVYHYFKSKKDILIQIERDGWQTFHEMVYDRIKETDDPEEKIKLYIHNMIKYQEILADQTVMFSDSVELRKVKGRKEHDREFFSFLRNILGELAEAKGIKNGIDLTLAAFTLFAMVTRISTWYKSNGNLSLDEVAHDLTRFFLFGFYGFPPDVPKPKDRM
jgi:TetR/AcrR family transcriptional regulator, cholesterol catabolism regulator